MRTPFQGTVSDAIDSLRGFSWKDEDEMFEAEIQPPQDEAHIESLERSIKRRLPSDLREAMLITREIFCEWPDVEFGRAYVHKDPGVGTMLCFAHDGFGNCWAVDLDHSGSDLSEIYYLCHDPAVVMYHGTGIADFLADLKLRIVSPESSALAYVADDWANEVWKSDPRKMPRSQALNSADSDLRDFAGKSLNNAWIYDLREPGRGAGYVWASEQGVRTVTRHSTLRLFSVQEFRAGFFAKLLGRS